jgi:hypothetical protein
LSSADDGILDEIFRDLSCDNAAKTFV